MGRRNSAAEAATRRKQIYLGCILLIVLFVLVFFWSRGGSGYGKAARVAFNQNKHVPVAPAPGDDGNADVEKREAVRNAMKHAWGGYKQYAWGKDELKPVSHSSSDWLGLGCTIVDALDTLYIMKMEEEFNEAREWIAKKLHFTQNKDISFFETTIRELGGLLAAYDLSGDEVFLLKARELADILLVAFETPTGLPRTSLNPATRATKNPSWTGNRGVLAEMGSVQLEFNYLACALGEPDYARKSTAVYDILLSLNTPTKGLYPVFVETESRPNFASSQVTLGALGDSFYEYLLKFAFQTGNAKWKEAWDVAASAIKQHLVQESSPSHLTYIAEQTPGGGLQHKMDHLACFTGGMFMLGSNWGEDKENLELGLAITETCHLLYAGQATGIGPEVFNFREGMDWVVPVNGKHYLLRPETVESYFYAWRFTHDEKWRRYGWEAFQAIETHCRTDVGYSGIRDVTATNPLKDDQQQSFFLAETLKYLYLLFEDDSVISLESYAFNTEAHPLSYPLEGCT